MRRGVLLLALLLLPAAAGAQTTNTFLWDYDATPTVVATYTQVATVDGVAVSGSIACAPKIGAPTQTTCSTAIAPLAAGSHTLSVTATVGGVSAETRLAGVNLASGPKSATLPRIVVSVTVTVP